MEQLLNFLKEFNFQTILSMTLIVWYFTRDIKNSVEAKIDRIEKDLRYDIKIQSARSDKLYENFCDLIKTGRVEK